MSRDYEKHCIFCNTYNARSTFVGSINSADIELYQCLNEECGSTWIRKYTTEKLSVKGITQQHWKKAEREAFVVGARK